MNNTILVTGGAGYIGSHACKALARLGYRPVTYDSLVTGHREAVKWGPLVEADIQDRAALDAAFERWRPQAIMHFAAFAYVGESVTDPGRYFRNNVTGSLTLLEAARDAGVQQFVFSSTCAVYGIPAHGTISERDPLAPVNPYGASKQMVERMLADFQAAHGLRSIALRYFNAAGADPQGEIGECHEPETHLLPLVLQTAAGRRPAVTIHGDSHPTPDGTCIRDFVHVGDLAQAHVLALQALERGHAGGAYNLGTGRGASVREVIDVAAHVTGRAIPAVVGSARPGDPPRLVADATRATSELEWRPQYVTLDAIVRTAWDWENRIR